MICFSFYGLGVNCFSCITRISLLGDEINDKSLIVFDLIFESEARWSLIGEGMAVTEHAMGLGTEGQKILIASPCISSILGLAYAPSIPGHMSVNFLFISQPFWSTPCLLRTTNPTRSQVPGLCRPACPLWIPIPASIYRPFTSQRMPALHLSLTNCLCD